MSKVVDIQNNILTVQEKAIEEKRNEAISRAASRVLEVVDVLTDKALTGDIQAMRLLLEVVGMVRRGVGIAIMQNNVQKTPEVPIPTLRDILCQRESDEL